MTERDIKGRFKKGFKANPHGRPKGSNAIRKLDLFANELLVEHLSECEVRERFRILNEYYHWFEIVISQMGYPDFLLKKDRYLYQAEVEIDSGDFVKHQHDIECCNLIICWRHGWTNCPIPVLTISLEWKNYCELKRMKPFYIFPEKQEKIKGMDRNIDGILKKKTYKK